MWEATEHAVAWFTKLVMTVYAWSDIIIHIRHNKVNKEWKKKKEKNMALQIMKEHQQKLATTGQKTVEKRADSMIKFVVGNGEGGLGSEMEEFVKWIEQPMDLLMD
jgi:anionic cell wall polymer biosynthesis LytR-Cps2A-Psr (LCP) family protein